MILYSKLYTGNPLRALRALAPTVLLPLARLARRPDVGGRRPTARTPRELPPRRSLFLYSARRDKLPLAESHGAFGHRPACSGSGSDTGSLQKQLATAAASAASVSAAGGGACSDSQPERRHRGIQAAVPARAARACAPGAQAGKAASQPAGPAGPASRSPLRSRVPRSSRAAPPSSRAGASGSVGPGRSPSSRARARLPSAAFPAREDRHETRTPG